MKCSNFSVVLLVALLSTGCASLTSLKNSIFGKASKKQEVAATKITSIDNELAANNQNRLTHIGAWAEGTDFALDKSTNQEPAIAIAKQTNMRVIALADKPNFIELQEIYKLVNVYMTNQTEAQRLLAKKDKVIEELNEDILDAQKEREEEVQGALNLAKINASNADTYKATLSKMDSFFGGGAIWYGFKKLITKLAWIIGGTLVFYIILRVAAAFNPIAATIFSIIDTIFSIFVKTIRSIAPKAVQVAGYVETSVFSAYKGTLTHVIDSIQMLKEKEKLGIDIKMDDLMTEMAKSMDEADKDRVEEIKKELHWV